MSRLESRVSGSVVVARNLPAQTIFFPVQLIVFTTSQMTAVHRSVSLLLQLNRAVFRFQLTIMPVQISSVLINLIVQIRITTENFRSPGMVLLELSISGSVVVA